MSSSIVDSFGSSKILKVNGLTYRIFSITALEKEGITNLSILPYSIRILLENMLRKENGKTVFREDILKVANYHPKKVIHAEIPFMPSRVVLQDFTGVPSVVDLAAMRDAVNSAGKNPDQINPIVQSDLVIDHSVQVDVSGTAEAFQVNVEKEYERNAERYRFLKWAQQSFKNFSAVPPGTGIIHQVNLEYLGKVVMTSHDGNSMMAYPDTLVGTDSHTTMINGLSILGWGVGGIEAEAVMLGQPYYMILPEVVGVMLTGNLPEGATATDLVLTITEMLRKHGVVGKFVEYFGSGLPNLTLPDRATIANMSPEYGATMGFFPIDDILLQYLRQTARSLDQVNLVEYYAKEQGLYRSENSPDPEYSVTLTLDMGTVESSLAGPKRPQDRVPLRKMKSSFNLALSEIFNKSPNKAKTEITEDRISTVKTSSEETNLEANLTHGSVVIAAITSCTNTSNPSVMIAAGLIARKALEKDLHTKPWVKTSFAPGSRVVTEYLQKSGLMKDLEAQRFNLVGYGCTTCIGNSGPLSEEIDKKIQKDDLVVAAVLSGNRNFEGRIHASVRANYLASPPLVVIYALAGRIDIDFDSEPISRNKNGQPIYLREIWPSQEEISKMMKSALDAQVYQEKYSQVFEGDEHWRSLRIEGGELFDWDPDSTYIKNPPFFRDLSREKPVLEDIKDARVIAVLGDSVTTDHISPAGTIPHDSPAGKYLISKGVDVKDFNSFGSRRGNHEVMMRGTFGNIRIKNKLLDNVEGGFTIYFPTGEKKYIYDAALEYQKKNIPLLVFAGKEYGTGSSRDWAAKGTYLLGIKAVIAESFERIHRSNLVGMGVLPLQFYSGDNTEKLGLTGRETYEIAGIEQDLHPGKEITITATNEENLKITFNVKARLDTPIDVEYYNNGGILQTVVRQMINNHR